MTLPGAAPIFASFHRIIINRPLLESYFFYTADRIFTGNEWLSGHAVIVDRGMIQQVLPVAALPADARVSHFSNCFIAPAFIDLQIYGAGGRLLSLYPDVVSLRELVAHNRASGTAFCQPAIATNTMTVVKAAIDAVRLYRAEGGGGIIGLHLEGPWINPVKRGAHIAALVGVPRLDEVQALLDYGKGVITMITLAPEQCSPGIIDLITSYNVVISAGHSNATYEQALRSFDQGIRTVTHLYNAMSALQHREPGMVGACFTHAGVMASVIADGHHVHYDAIRIAKKHMGERLFAITDAVTQTDGGPYPHQAVGNRFEAGGVLSGSSLTMVKALQNLVQQVDIGLDEALRMCSLYPAKVMGSENRYGTIQAGRAASLVVLDESLSMVSLISDTNLTFSV